MAKTREIPCIHYIAEKCCDLGKEGTFRKKCQTCKTYSAKRGARPARVDRRRTLKERIDRKEKW